MSCHVVIIELSSQTIAALLTIILSNCSNLLLSTAANFLRSLLPTAHWKQLAVEIDILRLKMTRLKDPLSDIILVVSQHLAARAGWRSHGWWISNLQSAPIIFTLHQKQWHILFRANFFVSLFSTISRTKQLVNDQRSSEWRGTIFVFEFEWCLRHFWEAILCIYIFSFSGVRVLLSVVRPLWHEIVGDIMTLGPVHNV